MKRYLESRLKTIIVLIFSIATQNAVPQAFNSTEHPVTIPANATVFFKTMTLLNGSWSSPLQLPKA